MSGRSKVVSRHSSRAHSNVHDAMVPIGEGAISAHEREIASALLI